FVPAATQTYTVTGTDANGCTNTSSVTITVNPLPTVGVNATPGTTVCAGTSVTLNGTGAVSYTWSGGVSNGVAFVPASTQTYTVTGTDANSCTNSASFVVTVNSLPNFSAYSNSPVCSGSDIQLNVTSASGTICAWSGPNSFTSSLFNEIIPLANEVLHEGNYTVIVTDLNTSCTNSQTVFVDVVNQISSTINPVSPICQNQGTIQLTAANTGGSWTGNGVNASGIFDPNVAGSGIHTITYTISGNCGSSSTTNITVLETPTASASYNQPVCENGVLNLQGNLPSSSVSYTVGWIGPNNYSSSQAISTISPASSSLNGVYWYHIQYANGCQDSSSVNVIITPQPEISNAMVTDASCFNSNNGSIDLSITSSATYNVTWSNGASTDDINNLNAGTYTVTVSVNGVCSASATYIVNSPQPVDLYLKDATQPNCGTNNGRIILGVTGGESPFTFTWQPNVSTDSVANQVGEGQYYIMLTDDNGCSDTLSVNLICIPDSLIIPQLVTPNNDGMNDLWEIDLSNYPNNVVKIFNRWGNLVFAANPYLSSNYWDGKVGQNVMLSLGSEYLPVGTYYYVIDLFGDGTKIFKGYIELQY
ncbi:MAG: gliding motility-associated C-terminal domain-containing protein, partial [Flavobacteriales bacterium]|nr:gliding motility-associated C-terminal domain-containing protein [Flavobacteriales bacterium]